MRTFDLDSSGDEWAEWRTMLAGIADDTFWDPLLSTDGYWGIDQRWEEVLSRLEDKKGLLFKDFTARAEEFLTTRYTHICMYHGTRIADETPFRRVGLKVPSDETLLQQAVGLFGDSERLRNAFSSTDCVSHRRNSTRGVWFFLSQRYLIDGGAGYCSRGSEHLNCIANVMENETMQGPLTRRLEEWGCPAVIICRLPLSKADWLVRSSVSICAAKKLFEVPPGSLHDWPHAQVVRHDIPADWIQIQYLASN